MKIKMPLTLMTATLLSNLGQANEADFLKSINGDWTLFSGRSRSLFIDKEICPESIRISASLEEGVRVSTLDRESTFGFEISANEIETKKPNDRSEWGKYKGNVRLTDHSITVVKRLPLIVYGYREKYSIRTGKDQIVIRVSEHSLLGHLTSVCKYN